MNKKVIAVTTSLVLGGTLLFGTALANASQLSGYTTYKNAVMDTKDMKNGTVDLNLSLADNGTNLVSMNSDIKLDRNSSNMSCKATVKSGSTTKTMYSYEQNGEFITKNSDSDQYLVRNENKQIRPEIADKTANPEIQKSMGVIIDTLIGSMQAKVTASNEQDGTKNVSINIGENDVSPLIDALTSLAFSAEGSRKMDDGNTGSNDIQNVIPKLQSDIKIKSINSTGSINKDDIITNQTAQIVISGKDAQGASHELTFNVSLNVSNINGTTPDKVDLTGKQVKQLSVSMNRDGIVKHEAAGLRAQSK